MNTYWFSFYGRGCMAIAADTHIVGCEVANIVAVRLASVLSPTMSSALMKLCIVRSFFTKRVIPKAITQSVFERSPLSPHPLARSQI
uniref:hypothetical protein n=1 Tax=Trichocoleus desertorum TaxID=1481672 RepID=UPI0025B4FC8D|nr:hypothetical protein [Trichocoleus desertorum]